MVEKIKKVLQVYGLYIGIGFAAVLLLTFLFAKSMTKTIQPETTYQPQTANEINFSDGLITFHTAADGVALVVAPQEDTKTEEKKPSGPEQVWTSGDTANYKQFTMPEAVQMDDESIGILTIPDIGLSVRAYESGDQMEDMTKGASHFKSTSAFSGNIGLSAHNINLDGSAGCFLNLYKLEKGAAVSYETPLGTKNYTVETVTEIAQDDWSYLGRTEDNRITLITCITGKPAKRLCVQAVEKIS